MLLEQPAIPAYLSPLIHELHAQLGDRLIVAFAAEHQGTRSDQAMIELASRRSGWIREMRLTAGPKRTTWFHSGLRKLARRHDVAVLAGSPRVLSNFAWLLKPGVGTVWWGQGWGPATTQDSMVKRVRLSNRFDVRLFYDLLEQPLVGPWAKSPTKYINNTILYSEPPPPTRSGAPAAHFCFVGRLTDKTGVSMLPALAAALRSRGHRGLRFTIIGDGPASAKLRSLIDEFGVSESFDLLGQIFDRDLISQRLRTSCFLVYPGAIGLTTQHALSEGLPVITHRNVERHGPESRLLTDGQNAFLCEESMQGFIEACERAMSLSEEAYAGMQANCLQIRQTHSIGAMARTFIESCELAHELASHSKRRAS